MLLNRGRNALGTSSGGGGGGGPYTAQAVSFDWSSELIPFMRQAATASADTTTLTQAGWFKFPSTFTAPYSCAYTWTAHFGEFIDTEFTFDQILMDIGTLGQNDLAIRTGGSPPVYDAPQVFSDSDAVPFDEWVFMLSSMDTSTNPPTGYLVVGTDLVRDAALDTASADTVLPINGSAFSFPYDFAGYNQNLGGPFEAADVRVWTTVCVEPTPANLAKFIDADGKPVDIAEATAAFGTPDYLFSGDSASFVSNKGSAGALTVYGGRTTVAVPGPGPGPIDLPGALVGEQVRHVWVNLVDVGSDFEATISVAGQIQQTGTQDFTGRLLPVAMPGTLTNATTSPSD